MNLLVRVAVMLAVVVLAGCTTTPPLTEDGKARLIERAEARWQALVAQDWRAPMNTPRPPTGLFSAKRCTRPSSPTWWSGS